MPIVLQQCYYCSATALLFYCHSAGTVLQQCYYCTTTVLLLHYNSDTTVLQQCYYIVLSQCNYCTATVLLMNCNSATIVLPQCYYCTASVLLLNCHSATVVLPQCYCCTATVLLLYCHSATVVLPDCYYFHYSRRSPPPSPRGASDGQLRRARVRVHWGAERVPRGPVPSVGDGGMARVPTARPGSPLRAGHKDQEHHLSGCLRG